MTVTQRTNNRLPATPRDGGRGGELARGLGALVALGVLVIGVPWALWSAFGAPWPSQVPDIEWATQPLSSEVLLSVLAVVVWLAWLQFVVCVAVEAVAEGRRRGLAPRVPGGGVGTQALARKLVAAVLLLVGTASLAAPAASASTAPTEVSSWQPTIERIVDTERTVAGAEARAERPASDGLVRATTAQQQGEDVTTYYDVKPPNNRNYDTLWDIAERYLGDGLRYKEIYAMNRDVVQPDGRTLSNPDLIYPGWVMQMPNDAKGPGLKIMESTRDDLRGSSAPAGDSQAGGSSSAGTTADATGAADAPAPGAGAAEAGSPNLSLGAWSPLLGVAGGLAMAGALIGLRRRRASGPGGGGGGLLPWSATSERAAETERARRVEAGLRSEGLVTEAAFVDAALRGLHGVALPAVSRAALSDSGLVLLFDRVPRGDLPVGWSRTDDDRAWVLPRDAATTGLAHPSPYPGLVVAGQRPDGAVLMLDLEASDGAVALGGDPGVARGVAMSLSAEVATHPWADRSTVTMVGFADDLSGLGDVHAVGDVTRVLDGLENVARDHRATCRAQGVDSVSAARRLSADASLGLHLVVCSGEPDPASFARLRAWAADPSVAVAVVVVGDSVEATVRLTATEDGRLVSPQRAIDVVAQQLDAETCRGLATLFELRSPTGEIGLEELTDSLAAEDALVGADDGQTAQVAVEVIGSVAVDAPGDLDEGRRELLTEVVTYLALHPDGVHVNVLTGAIWPRGVDAETRDATLRAVAAWLGSTATGEPVLEEDAGVWRLRSGAVRCDWDQFRAALNRAATGTSRAPGLRTALSLVRGPGFADLPAGRYGWLAHLDVERDIDLAIEMTALALAEDRADAGDPDGARTSLLAGLTALPASELLWCTAMRLAMRFSGRADTAVVADQMYAAIAQHGSPMGAAARTNALVDELIPGYSRGAA